MNFAVIPNFVASFSSSDMREKSSDLKRGRFAMTVGL